MYTGKPSRILALCLAASCGAFAKASVSAASGKAGETILDFSMGEGDFRVQPLVVDGKTYSTLVLDEGSHARLKGQPDLPEVAQAIIIPDKSRMRFEILASSFTERIVEPVISAKGNISRRRKRSEYPYVFGEAYSRAAWFPERCAHMGEPYIAGDFRGTVVYFQPFQYNPATKTLRVYTSISIKVVPTTDPGLNEKNRSGEFRMTADNAAVYARAFSNFTGAAKSHYKTLNEEGSMLVLSHADFLGTMQPFVEWKNRRGVKTDLVDAAAIGDAAAIKAYVADRYKTKSLKYLLLVGDADKVPTLLNTNPQSNDDALNHAADNMYGMIDGNDAYMEVFVGRLSGTTTAMIAAQTEKILHYERKFTVNDTWIAHGLATADESEADDLNVMKYIVGLFKAHTIKTVTEFIRDEDEDKLVAEVNKGVGVHANSSHASETSIQALGASAVSRMNNAGKYPFNFTLGCNPGDFRYSKVCLGEALLRKEKGGYAGAYMSSISQAWDEPYAAIKEHSAILCEKYPDNIKRTYGGLAINGSFKMLDQFPRSGPDEIKCWILFGDPNMHLYTDTPKPLVILHPASVGTGTQNVTVSGTAGASVCLYSKKMGIQAVSDLAGGKVSFPVNVAGNEGDTLYVTGTMFNHVTYEGMMLVSRATGLQAGETGAVKEFAASLQGTRILYGIPAAAGGEGLVPVSIRLFDAHGRVMAEIDEGLKGPGRYAYDLGVGTHWKARGAHMGKVALGPFQKSLYLENGR